MSNITYFFKTITDAHILLNFKVKFKVA